MTLFKSSGFDWRLFCGDGVIEASLPHAVDRAGSSRAFVVCSASIPARTDLVDRVATALGDKLAGVHGGIAKDSTYASVQAAVAAARDAEADLLIAIGGGSVLVATRAVAIFLGETGDPLAIMTQYPEGERPYSPRLMAPKPPIVNIPTTPTSAMNRAGTGLKNPDLDHRMEYFDPKTRPTAILLDHGALLSAPDGLVRSTATTVFAGAVAAMAMTDCNPLVEGDQIQAFRLAHRAYAKLPEAAKDPLPRRDLALAAFLLNRAEDDGRPVVRGGPFAGDYAVSTALHLHYPSLGQGEATAVVHAPAIRLARAVPLEAARRVAEALGQWRAGMDAKAARDAVADALEGLYGRAGMPRRLRDAGVARDALPEVAAATVRNFNARAGMSSPEARIAESLRLLEAAF